MTTTTPHPTAQELAEKAADEISDGWSILAKIAVAKIILETTKLEALIKCVEALRKMVKEFGDELEYECPQCTEKVIRKALKALRELDQTKGE